MMNYKQKKIMPTAKGHFRSDLDVLKVGYSEFKSYNLFINNYVICTPKARATYTTLLSTCFVSFKVPEPKHLPQIRFQHECQMY